MIREELYVSIDKLARYKYIRNRIDPSGLYPSGWMNDITHEEIEDLYREAADEIVSNIVNSVGRKPYVTAAHYKELVETEYQKLLEANGMPDSYLVRKDLYDKAETEYLANKYIDVGPSGVIPSGIALSGTCEDLAPYGIDRVTY